MVFVLIGFAVFAQPVKPWKTIKIKSLPTSVDEFINLRNDIAKTPSGGAAMFIIALKMYAENPEVGEQCLVIAVDKNRLSSGRDVYKGYSLEKLDMGRIKEQLAQYPYIPNSYFKGATPNNGYKFDFPTSMKFTSNAYSGNKLKGDFKVFVQCSGADSDRPIRLHKNDKGYWKAAEWSTILMGMRPPKSTETDDL